MSTLFASKWLRVPAYNCTILPWWQEYEIYQETRNRRQFIGIGTLPVRPGKVYESPLLEARRYKNLMNDPFIDSQADRARELGITRARVSQIMKLLTLAPEIQEELLEIGDQKAIHYFSERRLRPLLKYNSCKEQLQIFRNLKKELITKSCYHIQYYPFSSRSCFRLSVH